MEYIAIPIYGLINDSPTATNNKMVDAAAFIFSCIISFKGSKRKLLTYDEALKEINRSAIRIEKGDLL